MMYIGSKAEIKENEKKGYDKPSEIRNQLEECRPFPLSN
jgi:hypothetical protein